MEISIEIEKQSMVIEFWEFATPKKLFSYRLYFIGLFSISIDIFPK